ncbi:MAG: GNAT family N-acetyltransferase [Myxococcota bacterium]
MLVPSVVESFEAVPAAAWDALVGDGSPFLEHVFLATLEALGSATPATGWTPRIVLVHDGATLVGAAPAYVKTHSMGEFVYDHGWADAARRAGIPYFPKLIVGVPFTPVTGQRLLVHPDRADVDAIRTAILRGIERAARDCRGVHVLFDTPDEVAFLERHGLFQRVQYQFHWGNDGYRTFDDWLGSFTSDKRNKIRRERKELAGLRIEAITAPSREVLDALHQFHRSTASQFGPWGHVYLSRDVFRRLGEVWGHRLHAVVAWDGAQVVAGSFNVLKGDRLYGRYWGASDTIRFLHFEVCYYKAIEDCIARGVAAFEPGHGGGQKYQRGFVPTITASNHRLADPRIHDALVRYTAQEVEAVREELEALRDRQ